MTACKRCGADNIVRNGFKKSEQRYKCKGCGCNFIARKKSSEKSEAVKALAVLLYAYGANSYGMIAKLLNVSRTCVFKWIRKISGSLGDIEIVEKARELEFDEMWHFIGSKKRPSGFLRPMIGMKARLLDGSLVIVIVQPSKDSLTK